MEVAKAPAASAPRVMAPLVPVEKPPTAGSYYSTHYQGHENSSEIDKARSRIL